MSSLVLDLSFGQSLKRPGILLVMPPRYYRITRQRKAMGYPLVRRYLMSRPLMQGKKQPRLTSANGGTLTRGQLV
jgi:hypothetical protein